MAGNILIISSDYTGNGHKSITNSLLEKFKTYPEITTHVIDGFSMGGNMGLKLGKIYGPITRNAKELWKLIWDISFRTPSLLKELSRISIHDTFLKTLRAIKPDVIVSVHPGFVGSVIDILEQYNINIPLIAIVPDLISISPLWADKRALYTICPTYEAKERCMKFGVPEAKIKVTGFPVREKFYNAMKPDKDTIPKKEQISFLIMSGGEGSGNMGKLAEILLDNFDCQVRIIAGKNSVLQRRLENNLKPKHRDRIELFGFVENVQDLMRASDIAITRGSPNVIMEAVACNTPLIVTGALPGQEEENPAFLEKHNLGIVCTDIKKLKDAVINLIKDDYKNIKQIKSSQKEYMNPNSARDIAEFIAELPLGNCVNIPDNPKKISLLEKTNGIITSTRRFKRKVKKQMAR
ncbi:MAG: glycosyltransferase [Bacillota bacterium]|nr:glycosyltransferase [Bacillota bacterium]